MYADVFSHSDAHDSQGRLYTRQISAVQTIDRILLSAFLELDYFPEITPGYSGSPKPNDPQRTFVSCWCENFTARRPFLSPNERQNTEDMVDTTNSEVLIDIMPIIVHVL